MPTAYYVLTTREAMECVDANDYKAIDHYINNYVEIRRNMTHDWYGENFDTTGRNIHHLASHAVDSENIQVIKHLADKIDFHYSDLCHGGNAVGLIHLAVSNLCEKNISSDTLDTLCNIAEDTGQCIKGQLSYSIRRSLNYGDLKTKLLDYVISTRSYMIDLEDIFHSSLSKGMVEITQHLVDNYLYMINFKKAIGSTYEFCKKYNITESLEFMHSNPAISKHLKN